MSLSSLNYPFEQFLEQPIFGKSLEEQYQFIMDTVEKYKPELCLKMFTDDLDEFHHLLWTLPFYKQIYKVSETNGLFAKEHIYCQVVDSQTNSIELFRIFKWTLTTRLLKGSWEVKREIVSIRTDEFDTLFENMVASEPIPYKELPEGLQRNIGFTF